MCVQGEVKLSVCVCVCVCVCVQGEVGLSARVLLEALEGESVSSDLQIHNEGSTAIYYSWQRLPRPCSFPHTHTHTHTQHFYFNTSTGTHTHTHTVPFSRRSYNRNTCPAVL